MEIKMNLNQKIIKPKLGLLELAKSLEELKPNMVATWL